MSSHDAPRTVVRLTRSGDSRSRRRDRVAIEEPLEIRLNGESLMVTMRTPGDDLDLVHGLLHSERIIRSQLDVLGARFCEAPGSERGAADTFNVIDVTLAPSATPEAVGARAVTTTSACGICGTSSIDTVLAELPVAADASAVQTLALDPDLIASLPDRLRTRQRAFERTGGIHGAGLYTTSGQEICVREDIGRHNAVDKVIGAMLRAGRMQLGETVLVVSSRASFELVQKAALAGIPALIAVSAASSLAVDLARAADMLLVGFVRGETMNVYAGEREIAA